MPDKPISVAPRQEATATAASMALPPSISVRSPASDASGCADDTIPFRPVTAGRRWIPTVRITHRSRLLVSLHPRASTRIVPLTNPVHPLIPPMVIPRRK